MEKRVRESNIELLRIVAMALIVLSHLANHGVLSYYTSNITFLERINNYLTSLITYGGKLGVDIFIIICGYFVINSGFFAKHVLKTYLYTLFYSIFFLMAAFIIGSHKVPSSFVNRSLFPFFALNYWFISTYILLYLLTPFINPFIKQLNNKSALTLMSLIYFGWFIIPTFTGSFGMVHSDIGIFIFLYMLGAFIRLQKFKFLYDKKLLLKLSLISLFIIIVFLFIKLSPETVYLNRINKYGLIESPLLVIFALYLFNCFNSFKIKHNKIINSIATSVLGIYLIHDNTIVRSYIWHEIVKFLDVNSAFYIFKFVFIAALIFVFCLIGDKTVRFFVDGPISKLSLYSDNKLNYLYSKLTKNL